ncbi:unnamed protein product [Phaedon cochleariae]|uniref:Ammonium transporter AmtB-like domain-containing protein n=1 Tax=Phaedon cochleariae TaxID=80249 RepID=A0A9P0DH51_PHACE|nr:unnamed protein product [Phaedon cochleariae]
MSWNRNMNKTRYENLSADYHVPHEYIYYDIFNVQYSRATDTQLVGYGVTTTFLRIIFVLISRLGFIIIQMGSIPIENIYRIIFYNIFEIGNAIASYALVGFILSFGNMTLRGWIGYSSSLSYNLDEAILGISACLLGTAQISTFLIGRIHLVASIAITFLYCAFYQPLLMHWIWHSKGWMNKAVLLNKRVSAKDFAGDLVIHLSSSFVGLMGAMFLGRRLIKLKDLDEHSLGREQSGNTIMGYVFILFGYLAFSLPTPLYQSMRIPDNYIGIIMINNMVAFATGIILVSLLHLIIYRKIFTYWIILRCLQGGIAGVISVAAGVDIYSPYACIAIATVASVFFFFFSILVHNTALEDYCNFTSSHLVCSVLGSMACPLLAQKENFGVSARKIHVLWQFICLIAVSALTLFFAWLVFLFLSLGELLRSKREVMNHQRAVVVQKYLPKRAFLERLFMIDSNTDHIEPSETARNSFLRLEGSKDGGRSGREAVIRTVNYEKQRPMKLNRFKKLTVHNADIVSEANIPLQPIVMSDNRNGGDEDIAETYVETSLASKIRIYPMKENLE